VTTVIWLCGIETVMFLRLWTRAPRMCICSSKILIALFDAAVFDAVTGGLKLSF